MATLNNSNANVFYWPLSTGNKINTAYNIVPKLAKFFIAYVKNTRDFSHERFNVMTEKHTRHYIKGGKPMIKIKKNCTLETTWKELKDNIECASNPLNVGDEIDIVLKTGEKVTLVCERAGHRSATFFTKNLLEDTHCMNENWKAKNGEQLSTMEAYLGKLFRLLPDDLQEVATEPLRLLREKEVFGKNNYGNEEVCEVLPRYSKKENWVKTLNGVPFPYWLASPIASGSTYFCTVNSGGSSNYANAGNSYGVCFGFDI